MAFSLDDVDYIEEAPKAEITAPVKQKESRLGIKPPIKNESFVQRMDEVGSNVGQGVDFVTKYMNPFQNPLHYNEGGPQDYTNVNVPGTLTNLATDYGLYQTAKGVGQGLSQRIANEISGEASLKRAYKQQVQAQQANLRQAPIAPVAQAPMAPAMAPVAPIAAAPAPMAPVTPPPAPVAPVAQAPVAPPPPTLAQALQNPAVQNPPLTQVAVAQTIGPTIASPAEIAVASETPKTAVAPPVEPVKTAIASAQTLAPSASVPPPAEKPKPAKKPSSVEVKLLDTPKEWEKLTKEGKTFLPGYGAGDNNLFNTYGAEGRKAVLEKFNDGKPIGSYENYQKLNEKLRKGVPASEVAGLMARLPAESEAGNFGPLGKKALIKATGVGGLLLTAGELANAAQKAKEGNLAPARETGFNLLGMIPGLGTAFNAATYSKGLGEGEAEELARRRAIPPPASYRR